LQALAPQPVVTAVDLDQVVVSERGGEEADPHHAPIDRLPVDREALPEHRPQRLSRRAGRRLERLDVAARGLVQQFAGVPQQRPAVREAVHDQPGRAPGRGRHGAHREPFQALVGQDLPDRPGERLLLGGPVRRP
jgi:hypothetical protein